LDAAGACRADGHRALTVADWRLLIGVAALQVAVAAALRARPLPAVRHLTARLRPFLRWAVRAPDERAIWAIHATGRRLGRLSTCLTRAIVAELVVDETSGLTLTIGVRRTPARTLEAHAWLARGDRVLTGATPGDYVPLVDWHSRSA
jgi:hypothetical protein